MNSRIDSVPGINTTKVSSIDINDNLGRNTLFLLSLSLLLSSSLLSSLLLPLLLNNFQPTVATDFDINPEADHIDPDTDIEFTTVHHGCALYLYLLPILYLTQYLNTD